MKKFLVLILTLVLATTVWAANVKFDGGFFTAELPDNWIVVQKEATNVVVGSPDRKIAISFVTFEMEGHSFKEVADQLNTQYKGKGVKGGDGDAFMFECTANGQPTMMLVEPRDQAKKSALFVSISGDYMSDIVGQIMHTVEPK